MLWLFRAFDHRHFDHWFDRSIKFWEAQDDQNRKQPTRCDQILDFLYFWHYFALFPIPNDATIQLSELWHF